MWQKIKCSECQTYGCSVIYNNISFDGCLFRELKALWDNGVKTIGCCCGQHIDRDVAGYIQVDETSIDKMIELGYKPQYNDRLDIFDIKTKFQDFTEQKDVAED